MLKKTITYENYDGVKITEDFYFNLSKAEIMEMQLLTKGGLDNKLKKITDSLDAPEIMATFKELIAKSYGVKSADGKRLMKSPELSQAFMETEAYSDLFMELVTDADKAAEFFKAIVPKVDAPSIPAPADK